MSYYEDVIDAAKSRFYMRTRDANLSCQEAEHKAHSDFYAATVDLREQRDELVKRAVLACDKEIEAAQAEYDERREHARNAR